MCVGFTVSSCPARLGLVFSLSAHSPLHPLLSPDTRRRTAPGTGSSPPQLAGRKSDKLWEYRYSLVAERQWLQCTSLTNSLSTQDLLFCPDFTVIPNSKQGPVRGTPHHFPNTHTHTHPAPLQFDSVPYLHVLSRKILMTFHHWTAVNIFGELQAPVFYTLDCLLTTLYLFFSSLLFSSSPRAPGRLALAAQSPPAPPRPSTATGRKSSSF